MTMCPRRARDLLQWLLPLLVLRLLLPLGVMPGLAHGAPALVLCGLHLDSVPDAGLGTGSHGLSDPRDPGQADRCPFAAAAHLAPISVEAVAHTAFTTVLTTVTVKTGRRLALIGPPRVQLSRAPPVFS